MGPYHPMLSSLPLHFLFAFWRPFGGLKSDRELNLTPGKGCVCVCCLVLGVIISLGINACYLVILSLGSKSLLHPSTGILKKSNSIKRSTLNMPLFCFLFFFFERRLH